MEPSDFIGDASKRSWTTCFANDPLDFVKADKSSLTAIEEVLREFNLLSGLQANQNNSKLCLSGVYNWLEAECINPLRFQRIPFQLGTLVCC